MQWPSLEFELLIWVLQTLTSLGCKSELAFTHIYMRYFIEIFKNQL